MMTPDVLRLQRADRFHALALEIEDALFNADLKPVELRMARLIVKLSLRLERTTTPPLRQKDFGLLAGIRETHIAETLGWLLGKKVIVLEADNVYRPNADPKTWLVNDRVTPAARDREAELLRDDKQRELFAQRDLRAGDHRVLLADSEIEVQAELAPAADKLPKSGSRRAADLRNPEVEGGRNFRKSEVAETSAAPPRTRASATCHVPLPTAKHEHDHVHAPYGGLEEELKPDQLDLLDQVQELTGPEGKNEHFRRTWLMRIRDKPIAVFKAIGETRVAKKEGRIKRSIGGTLNWHYKNFREGAHKLGEALHLL